MMNIISPRPEDKEQWLELWQKYLDFYNKNLHIDITNLTWQRILDPAERVFCMCAYDDADDLVGFATYVIHRSTWAKRNYCYLEDLFVDESQRNQGVASALIDAVRDQAIQSECDRLYWIANDDNETALALYDKIAVRTDFTQYRMSLDE